MIPYYPTGFEVKLSLTDEQADNLDLILEKNLPDAKVCYSTPVKFEGSPYNWIIDFKAWKTRKIYEFMGKLPKHEVSIVFDGGFNSELINNYSRLMQVLEKCNLSPKEYGVLLGGGISFYKKQKEFKTKLVELVENGGRISQALPAPK